jgi:hypothetical protein
MSKRQGENAVFEEIFARMRALAEQMRGRQYDGHHDAVLNLIHDAEKALIDVNGKLGPWERDELSRATHAARINFLTLALNGIGKAIDISQLPPDEYEYGFNYAKPPQK